MLYLEFREAAAGRLGRCSKGMGPELVDIWKDIMSLGMEPKRPHLELFVPWKEFVEMFPGCRVLKEE